MIVEYSVIPHVKQTGRHLKFSFNYIIIHITNILFLCSLMRAQSMSSSTDITRRDGDGHIVASEMKGNPLIFEKVFFLLNFSSAYPSCWFCYYSLFIFYPHLSFFRPLCQFFFSKQIPKQSFNHIDIINIG